MIEGSLLAHVTKEHEFKDAKFFYRFTVDSKGITLNRHEDNKYDYKLVVIGAGSGQFLICSCLCTYLPLLPLLI